MNTTELSDYYTRASQAIRNALNAQQLRVDLQILDEPAFEALPLECQETLTMQGVKKDARLKFGVE